MISVLLFLTYPDAVQKVRLEISENHRVLLRSTQSVFCYIFFFTDLKNRVSILLGFSQTFQKPFCNCNAQFEMAQTCRKYYTTLIFILYYMIDYWL